jgi:hypothetical protein
VSHQTTTNEHDNSVYKSFYTSGDSRARNEDSSFYKNSSDLSTSQAHNDDSSSYYKDYFKLSNIIKSEQELTEETHNIYQEFEQLESTANQLMNNGLFIDEDEEVSNIIKQNFINDIESEDEEELINKRVKVNYFPPHTTIINDPLHQQIRINNQHLAGHKEEHPNKIVYNNVNGVYVANGGSDNNDIRFSSFAPGDEQFDVIDRRTFNSNPGVYKLSDLIF